MAVVTEQSTANISTQMEMEGRGKQSGWNKRGREKAQPTRVAPTRRPFLCPPHGTAFP
jgi:hypothetical protein